MWVISRRWIVTYICDFFFKICLGNKFHHPSGNGDSFPFYNLLSVLVSIIVLLTHCEILNKDWKSLESSGFQAAILCAIYTRVIFSQVRYLQHGIINDDTDFKLIKRSVGMLYLFILSRWRVVWKITSCVCVCRHRISLIIRYI